MENKGVKKVILFDKVTSALDPGLVGEVLEVIKDLASESDMTINSYLVHATCRSLSKKNPLPECHTGKGLNYFSGLAFDLSKKDRLQLFFR